MDKEPVDGSCDVSGTDSHIMNRLLALETANQMLDETARELAASGLDVLPRGASGSFANAGWPEYKDCEYIARPGSSWRLRGRDIGADWNPAEPTRVDEGEIRML
jgi:hypothetical protein